MGQHMALKHSFEEKTTTGYVHTVHEYQAKRCEGCPLRGMCHAAKTDRILKVNHHSAALRQAARQRLNSLRGIRRNQRSVDTEPVFGHIKQCRHFRRFLLTGLEGVSTEAGLLSVAHNLKKWWAQQCKHGSIVPLRPANAASIVQMTLKTDHLALLFEKIRA